MPGYSKKALIRKLGVKENFKIKIINPPENYFEMIETPKQLVLTENTAKADFIHCFVKNAKELEQHLPKLKKEIHKDGMIWISWPKKSSGVATDVNENSIRNFALGEGLVDVKVCAIDEVWSGLKLVYRLEDR
jgi:hypothetical protein